jgi:NADH-quinone oxidoreductase subunit E
LLDIFTDRWIMANPCSIYTVGRRSLMAQTASPGTPGTDIAGIDELLDGFSPAPGVPLMSMLIPVLQGIQERCGWLAPEALEKVSEKLRLPLSQIYGVVTFYAQFYLEPRGRHTVRVCRGTACHVRGASTVLSTVEQVLDIRDGETTPDLEFTIETVACLGTCFLAPVMMIDENYYGKLDAAKVHRVFKEFREGGGEKAAKPSGKKKKKKRKSAGKK